MKKLLLFILIIVVIAGISAQSPAKQDTLKGEKLEAFIEALEKQKVFIVEQERIQTEYKLLVEEFSDSDSLLTSEFNKSKRFYYFIGMEKAPKNLIDDSKDTIVVREVYREKEPELKEIPRNQKDYDIWILKMKNKYLKK